jgi:hypothetical protein
VLWPLFRSKLEGGVRDEAKFLFASFNVDICFGSRVFPVVPMFVLPYLFTLITQLLSFLSYRS